MPSFYVALAVVGLFLGLIAYAFLLVELSRRSREEWSEPLQAASGDEEYSSKNKR